MEVAHHPRGLHQARSSGAGSGGSAAVQGGRVTGRTHTTFCSYTPSGWPLNGTPPRTKPTSESTGFPSRLRRLRARARPRSAWPVTVPGARGARTTRRSPEAGRPSPAGMTRLCQPIRCLCTVSVSRMRVLSKSATWRGSSLTGDRSASPLPATLLEATPCNREYRSISTTGGSPASPGFGSTGRWSECSYFSPSLSRTG